jgi:hypothetical protein
MPERDSRNEFPFTVDELVERLKTGDAELAADILKEAEGISDRIVEGRVESVERRSATLQGVVAIAASFVLTGGALLVSQIEGSGWRGLCGVLLLMAVSSLALCGLRATQAASQWQAWSVPPAQAIFDRPEDGDELRTVGMRSDLSCHRSLLRLEIAQESLSGQSRHESMGIVDELDPALVAVINLLVWHKQHEEDCWIAG